MYNLDMYLLKQENGLYTLSCCCFRYFNLSVKEVKFCLCSFFCDSIFQTVSFSKLPKFLKKYCEDKKFNACWILKRK